MLVWEHYFPGAELGIIYSYGIYMLGTTLASSIMELIVTHQNSLLPLLWYRKQITIRTRKSFCGTSKLGMPQSSMHLYTTIISDSQ